MGSAAVERVGDVSDLQLGDLLDRDTDLSPDRVLSWLIGDREPPLGGLRLGATVGRWSDGTPPVESDLGWYSEHQHWLD